MKLGAALPLPPASDKPRGLADDATRLVDAGFESLWVFDAIGRGGTLPDPLMMLAVAATVTTGVELGTCILQVPLRETTDLANRILSLRHLAGGRLLLGVGFGSTRADFEAVGLPYDRRAELFESKMPVLRELVTTGRCGGVSLAPWPLGDAPVDWLLGSWGKQVRTAARDYDGWIASAYYRTDEALMRALQRYRSAGGRRAVAANYVVDANRLEDLERRLHAADEAGFDDVVVVFQRPSASLLQQVRALV